MSLSIYRYIHSCKHALGMADYLTPTRHVPQRHAWPQASRARTRTPRVDNYRRYRQASGQPRRPAGGLLTFMEPQFHTSMKQAPLNLAFWLDDAIIFLGSISKLKVCCGVPRQHSTIITTNLCFYFS
jgi:hypothetical protein